MPIKGAKYRVKTTSTGKKVRLAFQGGDVVEAKNLDTGEIHTQSEFKADKRKRNQRAKKT